MLDRPHSDLAALKHRRHNLGERIADLHQARDRLRGAEARETEALAAIGELGRVEVAAAREWAASAAASPPPGIDAARRAELTAALATAQAAAEAARGAAASIDRDLAEATREAVDLAGGIEAAALDAIGGRFLDEIATIQAEADRFRARLAHALAALEFIRAAAEQKQSQGITGEARRLFTRHAQLAQGVAIDIQPSPRDVAAHMPQWSGLYSESVK